MTSVTLSVEVLLALGVQLVAVVSLFVWLKADVRQLKTEVRGIRRQLGQEDGEPPGFVRTSECGLLRKVEDGRMMAIEQRLEAQAECVHALQADRLSGGA